MIEIKCPYCGSRDEYFQTRSGVDNCTGCEKPIFVGKIESEEIQNLKAEIERLQDGIKMLREDRDMLRVDRKYFMDETGRLREALEYYGEHEKHCLCSQWRMGVPTDEPGYDGYKTLYGYGKNEKWFGRNEYPHCTCGYRQALQSEVKE